MHEKIISALKNIETEHKCKILFACESGSRAWGFASEDSDYDVRFIYVNELKWYLLLEEKTDIINKMLPDELDVSGWELQKTLRLFAKCNLCLNEWLGSPIIYSKNEPFFSALSSLVPAFFNPKKAMHHYLRTAENMLNNYLHGEVINIKKLFYVLRPLLACIWILRIKSMPPTLFNQLLIPDHFPSEIHEFIENMLDAKSRSREKDNVHLPKRIADWIKENISLMNERTGAIETGGKLQWEPLNRIMSETLNLGNDDEQ